MSESTAKDADVEVHGKEQEVDTVGTTLLDALGISWYYLLGALMFGVMSWYEYTNQISASFVGELVFGIVAVLLLAGGLIKLFGRWKAVDFINL